MECSPAGSSVHRIFQTRILEWVTVLFSRGSSWPRDRTWVSCIASRFFTIWATREAKVNSLNLYFVQKTPISFSLTQWPTGSYMNCCHPCISCHPTFFLVPTILVPRDMVLFPQAKRSPVSKSLAKFHPRVCAVIAVSPWNVPLQGRWLLLSPLFSSSFQICEWTLLEPQSDPFYPSWCSHPQLFLVVSFSF